MGKEEGEPSERGALLRLGAKRGVLAKAAGGAASGNRAGPAPSPAHSQTWQFFEPTLSPGEIRPQAWHGPDNGPILSLRVGKSPSLGARGPSFVAQAGGVHFVALES